MPYAVPFAVKQGALGAEEDSSDRSLRRPPCFVSVFVGAFRLSAAALGMRISPCSSLSCVILQHFGEPLNRLSACPRTLINVSGFSAVTSLAPLLEKIKRVVSVMAPSMLLPCMRVKSYPLLFWSATFFALCISYTDSIRLSIKFAPAPLWIPAYAGLPP